MSFTFSEYLKYEWVPTLGCTEPACIAYAAATAHEIVGGTVRQVRLRVDPRMFKNCFAVGIPHSGHKTGIEWTVAIGSQLPSSEGKLKCFHNINQEVLIAAEGLIDDEKIRVDVEQGRDELLVDVSIITDTGTGRCVIENDHTNIVLREKDSVPLKPAAERKDDKGVLSHLPYDRVLEKTRSILQEHGLASKPPIEIKTASDMRRAVAEMSLDEMIDLARSISKEDRAHLRGGVMVNCAIAEHGTKLFPQRFINMARRDNLTKISTMVCTGVYARMWGEDLEVMSLAGSGNKGITVSVPLSMWGGQQGVDKERIDEALALACLVTSATTHHLGSLAAVCGCSNAAGIGLAVGLVYLDGGKPREMTHAINNIVGNVTGMICDGAKIGCAMKTMTAVDAAFRAASLAMADVGIPYSDGIIGHDTPESLANLARIAGPGMKSMDEEILTIMTEKLQKTVKPATKPSAGKSEV